ncbi:hypothetical protein PC116_g20946 [Phytophthora cactorum]|uniref:Uncharacterized protein n=1 Tax=Phytophthora cactorum TaxID=29920 RepID=A0A8T1K959_9STRA|nr:hypothetical protein PC117_g20483 [Phytophthora cactorum]KAG3004151.1 hypothetical protein PC120_g18745 [Phytophthora cactorum]KAG4046908.1 hypothetical protein PC123_g17725 [Phytophthora cactorum]KAG4230771.1 hypothetical protein PC116_g20946 [Phytophthora cactorum]
MPFDGYLVSRVSGGCFLSLASGHGSGAADWRELQPHLYIALQLELTLNRAINCVTRNASPSAFESNFDRTRN